jgi:hypothetical protein
MYVSMSNFVAFRRAYSVCSTVRGPAEEPFLGGGFLHPAHIPYPGIGRSVAQKCVDMFYLISYIPTQTTYNERER